MDEQFEHLTDAQIEQYGKQVSGSGPDENRELDTHLAACAGCRIRVLASQRSRLAVLADPDVKTAPHADCPAEDDLRRLAAGLCPPDQASQLTRHAAQCDFCGPLLRTYTEDFSDDLTPDDPAILQQLKSASPAWQRELAATLVAAALGDRAAQPVDSTASGQSAEPAAVAPEAVTAKPQPAAAEPRVAPARGRRSRVSRDGMEAPSATRFRFPWFKWVLVPTAVAACAAVAFFIWYQQRETPERVEKLLAQAYTEQRTMEMRIPYAAHADFKQTRGGDSGSLLSSPESLRKAIDMIAAELKRNPDDPKWLLLSARLDLMEWRYKPALSTLDKIEDAQVTDSSEMRLTRALALYEQAEFEPERRAQSYGEIVNLMGQSLSKTPDDPVALFNRATACEKILAYECAAGDYKKLLSIDKDNGWSQEINDRLKRIEEKKNLGH